MNKKFDYVVLGLGMYGLYATLLLLKKGYSVAAVEIDGESFMRASFINQARVHYGYHYPRSYSTAHKSAEYFDRFNHDFHFAINSSFKKIYAISKRYSLTSGDQFRKFCVQSGIPCKDITHEGLFKKELMDGVFETVEYAYDAQVIKNYFLKEIEAYSSKIVWYYNSLVKEVERKNNSFKLTLNSKETIECCNVLNATYGSVNQVNHLFGFPGFKLKYEICEIVLCKTSENIINSGITVMDGPFFSVMPFGFTGYHSLTSVTFTPHKTSYSELPVFDCQNINKECSPNQLMNCNSCISKPKTAWIYMSQLANKYFSEDVSLTYSHSLFSMKPILAASELDDSRPTLIRELSENPRFISVLSGKINTVYDLDEVLV